MAFKIFILKNKSLFLPCFARRVSLLLIIILNIFLIKKTLAEESGILKTLGEAALEAGYNAPTGGYVSETLDTTIGLIIAVILSFLGVIFLTLIIYSGFQWLTAGGNEETITIAKKRLKNAVIGLIIVLAGYIISYFVITQLTNIISGPTGPGGGSQP